MTTHPCRTSPLLAALTIGAVAATASSHVTLDAPNGGETLEVGSTYTIAWHVEIAHDTEAWHLSYSTTGTGGPWIPIANDLPAGDISQGAEHDFEWTVPGDVSDAVRVRVVQENGNDPDFDDLSDADLEIVPGPPAGDVNDDGVVNVDDLVAVILAWGDCPSPPAVCPADVNGDGAVDVDDLVNVILEWG